LIKTHYQIKFNDFYINIKATGSTINLAIQILKEHGVEETNIILLCLFSTPTGLQAVNNKFPNVDILTSEIHPNVPTDFGQRYFGTE
jgi:uracil phosphoribosyltransferase